jgi:hypothetical protein
MVEEFAANFLLSPMFQDIHRVVNSKVRILFFFSSFVWRASSHWVLGLQKVELTIMEVEL